MAACCALFALSIFVRSTDIKSSIASFNLQTNTMQVKGPLNAHTENIRSLAYKSGRK